MDENGIDIRVSCYPGYRGEQYPGQFHIGERQIGVSRILDRWLDPTHRYFKVRGEDEGVYILRHDTRRNTWELFMYDSDTDARTRLTSTESS